MLAAFIGSSAMAVSLLAWSGLPYSPIGSLPLGGNPYEGPEVEQVLVTLSEIEVNKKKTGKGSPWLTVVDEPVTFDLWALAGGGVPSFLGDVIAEPGFYQTIRMHIDTVMVKLKGVDELIHANPSPPKIQIIAKFEVMEGQLTRLLLDFDSGKALVETPPGSRNFNFKPRVKATLLLEGGAPPTGGESATLSRTTDKTSGLLLSPAYQGEEEGGGTLEIVLGDTTTSEAATPDVQGKVVVQGMDATNNTGTDVAVFLGEAPGRVHIHYLFGGALRLQPGYRQLPAAGFSPGLAVANRGLHP